MSVFDRFGTGLRSLLPRGDVSHKRVAELSDAELEAELVRRRKARAEARSVAGPIASASDRDNPERQQLVQYYANLELPPFASAEDVRRAYKELVRRYHPDKHAGDPERQKIAGELVQSLTKAYEAILAAIDR